MQLLISHIQLFLHNKNSINMVYEKNHERADRYNNYVHIYKDAALTYRMYIQTYFMYLWEERGASLSW